MRVEHTGDGVTRRPTVLKTVAVTGLHALPQLTIPYSSSIGARPGLAESICAGKSKASAKISEPLILALIF